jgi:hypothetical protein
MKTRPIAALSGLAALLLVGCQSTEQWMASVRPKAIDAAEKRGRFELNCPAATAQVLSEQDVPPEIRAVRFQGPDRAVFTIGVSGCNKRATYVVVCPDDGSNNCFAADGQR